MITLEEIQKRLAQGIKHCSYTQTELANMLGIKQQTVSHYVKGDFTPALDTFANLCNVLDIDSNFILGIESKKH